MSEEERSMMCAECQAECDDFHFDEDGKLVSHCPSCPYGGEV